MSFGSDEIVAIGLEFKILSISAVNVLNSSKVNRELPTLTFKHIFENLEKTVVSN